MPKHKTLTDLQPALNKHFQKWEIIENAWNADLSTQEYVFLVTGKNKQLSEENFISEFKHINEDRPVFMYGPPQSPVL
jgi:hypothetical protein